MSSIDAAVRWDLVHLLLVEYDHLNFVDLVDLLFDCGFMALLLQSFVVYIIFFTVLECCFDFITNFDTWGYRGRATNNAKRRGDQL